MLGKLLNSHQHNSSNSYLRGIGKESLDDEINLILILVLH